LKTRYRGRYVIGFDETRDSHTIIDNGEVVVEDNRIEFVGKQYRGEVDREVDATDCLISPGFINAHALMDVSIYQYAFDRPREKGYYRPRSWVMDSERSSLFSPDELRRGAELSFLNMVRSGCTTMLGITSMVFKRWHDPVWEPEVYLQAAVKLGLRAYLSHHYRSWAPYTGDGGGKEQALDEKRGLEGLEHCIEFIEKYDGAFGDRIRGALFPYTLDQSSPRLLEAT
jgi:cytosine/adenosine deaminase-related metal-dependent hydrolase